MTLLEHDLIKMATAYIKDRILIKWRYDSFDKEHMDSKLNIKQYSKEPLTQREINYIMKFENVVMVTNYIVRFHNFSGDAWLY